MKDFIKNFKRLQKQIAQKKATLNPVSNSLDQLKLKLLTEVEEQISIWMGNANMLNLIDNTVNKPIFKGNNDDDDIEDIAWRRMSNNDVYDTYGTADWDFEK